MYTITYSISDVDNAEVQWAIQSEVGNGVSIGMGGADYITVEVSDSLVSYIDRNGQNISGVDLYLPIIDASSTYSSLIDQVSYGEDLGTGFLYLPAATNPCYLSAPRIVFRLQSDFYENYETTAYMTVPGLSFSESSQKIGQGMTWASLCLGICAICAVFIAFIRRIK